jgi:ribosomal protein S11
MAENTTTTQKTSKKKQKRSVPSGQVHVLATLTGVPHGGVRPKKARRI